VCYNIFSLLQAAVKMQPSNKDFEKLSNVERLLKGLVQNKLEQQDAGISERLLRVLEEIAPTLKSDLSNILRSTNQTSITIETLNGNPILQRIFEIYMTNLAPQLYNGDRYIITLDMEIDKDIVFNLAKSLDLNNIIYEVLSTLIVDGKCYVWLVNYSNIEKLLNVNKESYVYIENTQDYDFAFMQLRNLQNSNKKNENIKVTISNNKFHRHTMLYKAHIVNKTRVKALTLGKLTIAYLVVGNPFTQDLHTPINREQNNPEREQLLRNITNALANAIFEGNEEMLKKIKQDLADHFSENIFLVPVNKIVEFSFPKPYDEGLIKDIISLSNLYNLLIQKIATDIVNERKVLNVTVEVSNLSNAHVSHYLQQALTMFKSELIPVNDIIPAQTFPKFLTPYNILIIPTKNGQKYFNIEGFTPIGEYNPNLQSLSDMLQSIIGKVAGLPASHLIQETETALLGIVSSYFLEKIIMLQEPINQALTKLVLYYMYLLDKDLYYMYAELLKIELTKPVNLIFNTLSEIFSSLSTMQSIQLQKNVNFDNLIKQILGEKFYEMLTKENINLNTNNTEANETFTTEQFPYS
jgi:hypothetical protein